MNNEMSLAANWILNSSIQDENGGFHVWYDPDKKIYEFLYSEITGYAITSLIFIKTLIKEDSSLTKAKKAARWLLNDANSHSGGFKTRKYKDNKGNLKYSFEAGWVYAFDSGMILCGLMNLWKVTNEERYLSASIKVGNFLTDKMQKEDGSFFSYYVPSEDKRYDLEEKWSTQSGSYHAKIALGLIKLGRATGNDKYIDCAKKACLNAISYYSEGRFITNRKDKSTHLHPHCYTIEGLLYAGEYLNRRDFVDYAKNATKWALSLQEEDGGIPFMFLEEGKSINYQRSDVLAQVLRLGSICQEKELIEKECKDKLRKLKNRLCKFQNILNREQIGAFSFGYDFNGKKQNHLNSWCTMFALQALAYYENNTQISTDLKIDLLI